MSRFRLVLTVGAAALCALGLATPAALAAPTLTPSRTVVGPSALIDSLGGFQIARDGSGGLVYTAADHVFVSRFVNGAFAAPVQVDGGQAGPSSQPVIAAGNGGLLLVAWINGGTLYVSSAASSSAAFGAPQALAGGASNPAISANNFATAYLSFTVGDGSGSDVRAAYYDSGRWGVEPTALNATPADNAGTGAGASAVTCAGDGVGVVAWGESGHVYVRRVWGVAPSTEIEQADPPSVSGWTETSADEPTVGAGGDSSYVTVGFRESLANGSATQTRVLMNRLIAENFKGAVGGDALGTPGADSAGDPQAVIGEYGRGFLLSARTSSHALFAQGINTNDNPGGVNQVDTGSNSAAPYEAGGTAGLYSSIVAWQSSSSIVGGLLGPATTTSQVDLAFGTDGAAFGGPQLASDPTLGSTNAANGIAASGDVYGDAGVAWVQGTGAGTRIEAALLYQPPGAIVPSAANADSNSSTPTFSWTAAREAWGPVLYIVTLNGQAIGETTSTSLRAPAVLPDGKYTWDVIGANSAGLHDAAKSTTIHVDTYAPKVTVTVSGSGHVDKYERARVTFNDVKPGATAATSSGIASATLNWGDGSTVNLSAHSLKTHEYTRTGSFTVTATVTDNAGNTTKVTRRVKITEPPKRKPRKGT